MDTDKNTATQPQPQGLRCPTRSASLVGGLTRFERLCRVGTAAAETAARLHGGVAAPHSCSRFRVHPWLNTNEAELAAKAGALLRSVVQPGPEPAFDFVQRHAFAQVIIQYLIAAELADGKVF